MSRTIRIDVDVSLALEQNKIGAETPNDTIRRLIGLTATPAGDRRRHRARKEPRS